MDITRESNKRYRSSSTSSASTFSSGKSSPSHSPPPKFHRQATTSTDSYTCYLPPHCNQPGESTSHASEAELENHQLLFHNHVCRVPIRDHTPLSANRPYTRSDARNDAPVSGLPDGFVSGGARGRMRECGKLFPDERLLQLHHTEVHDAIAKEKQTNGGKIFECFVPGPSCGRKFKTPATRRSHLQSKHQYPAEYFFAITNHGLNQIIQQEGLAASLIRPRHETQPKPHPTPSSTCEQISKPQDPRGNANPSSPGRDTTAADMDVDEMDELAGKLDSTLALAFVPPALRRKGARGKGGTAKKEDILME